MFESLIKTRYFWWCGKQVQVKEVSVYKPLINIDMAAVATISLVDAQKILDSWANSRASDDEVIEFANAALKQLENPDNTAQFARNVEQAGIWANEVDAAFDRVTRGFVDMTEKYGSSFPDLYNFLQQWKAYEKVRSSFCLVYTAFLRYQRPEMGSVYSRLTRCSFNTHHDPQTYDPQSCSVRH